MKLMQLHAIASDIWAMVDAWCKACPCLLAMTEQRMLSGTLATNMPKWGTRTPYNQRYLFRSKFQEYHGTPRKQDEDIWQEQEVLARPQP